MKRHWKLALASLMAVLLGIAGLVAAAEPGVTANQVLIGAFQDQSGPAAVVGINMRKGMEAYLNWINSQGGVNGRKIKLIVEDDGFQPSRSIAATKKLIEQDKVFALVGTLGTPGVQATIDYIQSKKVPSIYHGSGISELAFPPKKYFFPVQPNFISEGRIIAQYVVQGLGCKRIAVACEQTDIGSEGLRGVKEQLAVYKMEPVEVVNFGAADVDFSSQVLKLIKAKPDAVIIYSTLKPCAGFLKQADVMGLDAQFLTTYVNADPIQMPALAGEACVGVIAPGWVPVPWKRRGFRQVSRDLPGNLPWRNAKRFRGSRIHRGRSLLRGPEEVRGQPDPGRARGRNGDIPGLERDHGQGHNLHV